MCEIIFVCTGNTCRSPMAAALAAAIFEREGLKISVSSCGVGAYGNCSASQNAVAAMNLERINLSAHKSRLAASEILENAALVLTMTRAHLSHVKRICPAANAFTLGEYAGIPSDISDPFGGSLDEYCACASQIKNLLENCIEKIRNM